MLLLQKAENYFPTLSPRVPGSSLSYNKPQSEKKCSLSPRLGSFWMCEIFDFSSALFKKHRNAPRFNVLPPVHRFLDAPSHNLERKIAKLLSHFCVPPGMLLNSIKILLVVSGAWSTLEPHSLRVVIEGGFLNHFYFVVLYHQKQYAPGNDIHWNNWA